MNLKNILYSLLPTNTYESLKQNGSGPTWTYVDNRREYKVICRKDQVFVKFPIQGKYNAMLTLEGEAAKKMQNLIQNMGSQMCFTEIPGIPMQPMKPMAPVILSFDSAAKRERKTKEYSQQLGNYVGDCQKYDVALIDYNAKINSYRAGEKNKDKLRKNLLEIIDSLFDQSIVLLKNNKIPS